MSNTVRIYETDDDLIYSAYILNGDDSLTERRSILDQYEDYYDDDEVIIEGLYQISDLQQLGIGPIYNYNVIFNCYELSRMKNLYTLVLNGVQILRGLDPSVLKHLNLNTVNLENIQIRGSLQSFSGCTISSLEISRCEFSNSAVTHTVDMTVRRLILSHNGLMMYTIPVIESMKILKITGENIHSIGPNISRMSELEVLHVEQCGLTGNIPSSMYELSNLRTLILSKNQLDGSISSSTKNLSNLKIIDLSHNQIEGTVPILPTSVDEVRLHHNGLSGHIGTVFMPTIHTVSIYGNPGVYANISSDRSSLIVRADTNGRVKPHNREDWFSSIAEDSTGYEYIVYTFLGMYSD